MKLERNTIRARHDAQRRVQTRGIPDVARDEIERMQPYHTGKDAGIQELATLNELVNADKQRTLTLCGTAIRNAILRAPRSSDRWVTGRGPFIDGSPLAYVKPSGDEKPYLELDIAFDVAFDYRTPFEGAVVVPTLRDLAQAVVAVSAILVRFAK